MPSHLHLIARSESNFSLSEILRDFKKFTSKAIIKEIMSESESRRDWMLEYFRKEGTDCKSAPADSGNSSYRFWQEGNHPEEVNSNRFFKEKLDYIHNNPVKELIVERPEDYFFSSARNYADLSNPLEIVKETIQWQTY